MRFVVDDGNALVHSKRSASIGLSWAAWRPDSSRRRSRPALKTRPMNENPLRRDRGRPLRAESRPRPCRCTPTATPIDAADRREHDRLDRGTAAESLRLRAPTDMRRPISRVRSVTETSMMFMMPMPPTISETAATPASRSSMIGGRRRGGVRDVLQVTHLEIVGLAG